MKSSHAVRIAAMALQISAALALALSVQAVYTVLSSAFSPENLSMRGGLDEATGALSLTLDANIGNGGLLGVDLYLEIGILNQKDEYVARNSTSLYIGPGERRPFSLRLTVPAGEMQRQGLSGDQGGLDLVFRVRTLANLVGLTNNLRIRGGMGGG